MKLNKQKNQLSFLLILIAFSFSIQSCKEKEIENKKEGIREFHRKTNISINASPARFPNELDAVIAAQKNYKILLENYKVRVLEVTIAPKEIEPLHHHKWSSVIYIMEADNFIDRDIDGNIILDTRQLSEPLVFPMTMYKNPELTHAIENLSETKTIRMIRVEMKK
jgi:hypothetical protein